jgi:Ca2+-transporting ATPase
MATTQKPLYQEDTSEISKHLQTDAAKGLSPEDAAKRLEEYGKNEISATRRISPWLIFLHQFKSAVVYLLLAAAGLSAFFKEWADAIAILLVIVINAVVGFVMEYQAENSMQALRQMTKLNARVVRKGKVTEIPVEEIVPGDLLFLEAGDVVPADGRVVEAAQLQVNESALTGESVPVEKNTQTISGETPLAERTNMLFKGTFVSSGNAKAICTATGMETELGNIASMVQSAATSATPLEKKLESFSRRLMGITVVIVVLIFLAGLLNKVKILEMLSTSIALAVAAIPEGLPIVATLALARGMLRMAKQQVIVKRLSAVETLGATTIICTDKTGTLTENSLEVAALLMPPDQLLEKDNAKGQTLAEGIPEEVKKGENYQHLLEVAVLCNNASIEEEQGKWKETGDPLETSLLKFARKTDMDGDAYRDKYPKEKEVPFSSETKVMGTLHKKDNEYFVAAKGAAEHLLELCTQVLDNNEVKPLSEEDRKKWLEQTDQLAGKGLKPLAFGMKKQDQATEEFMQDLVFLGLIGFLDPPREDVKGVIAECRAARIKVTMLTGDHPATASNIAAQLGIGEDGTEDVINGRDMKRYDQLPEEEKERWIKADVFARVDPRQKLDLVSVLQERGHIVAMTGDGVNDAPALKKADIGIAMGIRGTQVSQEVADMVLKDDAFTSIVKAIEQGRIIFENIRHFITFLLSCNLSELLVIGIAAAFNLPFQLIALQILFINLITDVLPALALGVTEGDREIMQQPPKDPSQPIIDRKRWTSIWSYSAVIAAAALGAAITGQDVDSPEAANNILFFTLIFSQLLHVLNMASAREPLFNNEIFRNRYVWLAIGLSAFITLLVFFIPALSEVLHVRNMKGEDWYIVAAFSFGSCVLVQVLKRLRIIL